MRRGSYLVALLVAAVALFAAPRPTYAAITVNSVTLDGGTYTAVEPGDTISLAVTVNLTNGDDWRRTWYQIEGQAAVCVDTPDHTTNGTYTETFTITAPATGGFYDIQVRAYEDNVPCNSGETSGTVTVTDAILVVTPNPDQDPGCGLDVVLVLDESGSIAGAGGSNDIRTQVRNGATGLVTSLAGTGSSLAVIEFNNQTGTGNQARNASIASSTTWQSVTTSYQTAFASYIQADSNSTPSNANYDPEDYGGNDQYTNWEAALLKIRTSFYNTGTNQWNGPTGQPPLIVFFTDGDPTAYLDANGNPVVSGTSQAQIKTALLQAVPESNQVKNLGAHIFVVGLPNPNLNEANVRAISGSDEYPTPETDFLKGDYTISTSAQLEQDLREVAIELCRNSLTVTKLTDEDGDDQGYAPDSGWQLTGTVSVTEAGQGANEFVWEEPVQGPAFGGGALSQTQGGATAANGTFLWQWEPTDSGTSVPMPTWDSQIVFNETLQPGYVFDGGSCTLTVAGVPQAPVTFSALPRTVSFTDANSYGTCELRNRRLQVDLTTATQCFNYTGTSPFKIATDTVGHDVGSANPATGVTLVHTFGSGVTYDSFTATGPGGSSTSCTPSGQTVTCTLTGSLAVGQTWVVNFFVTYPGGAQQTVQNTAEVSSNEADTDLNDNEGTCSSTVPVTLAWFTSSVKGGRTRFEWSTATEVGNVGFHLYEVTPTGLRRLNGAMIPTQQLDSTEPLDYAFEVPGALGGPFVLEDVAASYGATRQHGPFAANQAFGARPAAVAIDWAGIRAEDARLAAARHARAAADTTRRVRALAVEAAAVTDGAAPIDALAAAPVQVQLQVSQDGLQRVTYEALLAAGFDLAGVKAASLAVVREGQPVPVYVSSGKIFGPGGYVEFDGQAATGLYTNTRMYYLVVDATKRLNVASDRTAPSSSASPPAYYLATENVDRQRAYSPSAAGDDPWYDTQMSRGTSPTSWTFPFGADRLVSGGPAASLRLHTWGLTQFGGSTPDHHLALALNGQSLGEVWYDGQVGHVHRVDLPAGSLVEGANTLGITLLADTGNNMDHVMMDRYAVTYPRAFAARDGALTFEAAGPVFEVTNLPASTVVVYRFRAGQVPQRLTSVTVTAGAGGTYTARFAGNTAAARYVVSVPSALRVPGYAAAPVAPDIAPTGTDYLIITHPNFAAGLAPFVAFHQGRGLNVKVVSVQDVYTVYRDGNFDPAAIKAYVAAAQIAGVEHVLLVGGDTYDYMNWLGFGAQSFMPSLYTAIMTGASWVPSDPLYADANDDGVPDLAIGRWPVRTQAELDLVVAKTLAYAQKGYGGTGVFAADKDDAGISFAGVSEAFIGDLPAGWAAERAYVGVDGVALARQKLLAQMNGGTALTSFVGHSGPTAWTFSGLFSTSDARALTNAGRPTVVTQWGCWNTYHHTPRYSTLGQDLMLFGDRGAAAVMGATTLTLSSSEEQLGRALMPRMTQAGMTLGQALLEAKKAVAQTDPDLRDVLLGWTLLGDPAMVVEP